MAKKDVIVIGGSAGSHSALRQIMRDLAAEFPASIFVTTHMPMSGPAYLADVLASASPIPVSRAVDGQPVGRGRVYAAIPNRHLLLVDGIMRLGDGPRENMTRPAIDPLFRSAALAYGPRAVGVVLSGMLNDGASGLQAIEACGGTAVVQHPLDAHADEMPLAALQTVTNARVAPANEVGRLLNEIASENSGKAKTPPPNLALEVEIAAGARVGSAELRQIANPSTITCPDCHGVLSEVVDGKPLRYRCQTGHAFSAEVIAGHNSEVNEAMGVALRVMEERLNLVTRMAEDARATGRKAVAELYEARASEYDRYARILREAAISARSASRRDHPDNVGPISS